MGKKYNNSDMPFNPYDRPKEVGKHLDTYIPHVGVGKGNIPLETVSNGAGQEVQDNNPVVGFLYTMSRGYVQYWPLHLGKNLIGRSPKCPIQLCEASISEVHASISLKRLRTKDNKLIASVQDEGSKNGILLNDEELDYEKHSCKNLDKLTIGTAYQLLVILIDCSEYGLTKAENFMPTDGNITEQDVEEFTYRVLEGPSDRTMDLNDPEGESFGGTQGMDGEF